MSGNRGGAKDGAQLVECLPHLQELQLRSLMPHKLIVFQPVIPALPEEEAGGSEFQGHLWLHNKFEASLGYMGL